MKLGFLASFIALILIISISIKRQNSNFKKKEDDFWARERQANSVRRKSLDGLNYIKIPLETFPTHLLNDNTIVMDCIDTLESLTSQKIVNLTGWSNTDLKLEYGTANINILSEYDQNYTVLVRTLQKWADELLTAGFADEAAVLMEFAAGTGTDTGRTYYRLSDYYASRGKWEQIDRLIQIAERLRSSNKETIVKHLREKSI